MGNNFDHHKKSNLDGWFGPLLMLSDDYDHLAFYVKNTQVRLAYLDRIVIINGVQCSKK